MAALVLWIHSACHRGGAFRNQRRGAALYGPFFFGRLHLRGNVRSKADDGSTTQKWLQEQMLSPVLVPELICNFGGASKRYGTASPVRKESTLPYRSRPDLVEERVQKRPKEKLVTDRNDRVRVLYTFLCAWGGPVCYTACNR